MKTKTILITLIAVLSVAALVFQSCKKDSLKPYCDFEANQIVVEMGETIHFTDKSTNNPTTWNWDFGDGNTSNQKNPTHIYYTQGNYTVTLEVSNQHGMDIKTIENYIQVTFGMYIQVVNPNGGEEWQLGTSHEITWNDNITDNVKINLLKNNTVVLSITNSTPSNGNFSWLVPRNLVISNLYKIQIVCTNNTTIIDDSNNDFSITEAGNIEVTNPNSTKTWVKGQFNVNIGWETGNLGGTVTIQMYKGNNKIGTITPNATNSGSYNEYDVQTFLEEGDDYSIKIISNVNEEKFGFSEYFEIIEDNLPPEPPFDPYPSNQEIIAELTANLFWSCNDPEGDFLTYDVYAEKDNDNPTYLLASGLNTNTIPFENLEEGSRYYWKVIAKDNNNNSTESSVWWFETENIEPPFADFIADITFGDSPLTVSFTDLSTNNPTEWLWEFGDGATSQEQSPTYVYNNAGSYTVSLLATNNGGVGNEMKEDYIIAIGPCPSNPTVTDVDGNVYNTVQIGTQCWMKENLMVGTRIDGIQEMTSNSMVEKYCYDDDPANCGIYGGLYQWDEMMQYSTSQGVQGICPSDWHLPTNDEWKTMEMALGMSQNMVNFRWWRGTDEGEKMKSTSGWDGNGNGTNSSGFTALPGGLRGYFGSFSGIGRSGEWWSSSTVGASAYFRMLYAGYNTVLMGDGFYTGIFTSSGLSVRCLKD